MGIGKELRQRDTILARPQGNLRRVPHVGHPDREAVLLEVHGAVVAVRRDPERLRRSARTIAMLRNMGVVDLVAETIEHIEPAAKWLHPVQLQAADRHYSDKSTGISR